MAEVHDSALQLNGESALEELAAAVLEHSAGPVCLTAEQVGSFDFRTLFSCRCPEVVFEEVLRFYGSIQQARTYNTGPWGLGIR